MAKNTNFKKGSSLRLYEGFNLIELLVVISIIGFLALIVLAALNSSRNKGADGAVKYNLANARSAAEIFYSFNTVVKDSYTSVCTNGTVGGVKAVGAQVLAATKAVGLAAYATNAIGTNTTATCNDSAGFWAAEVPLTTPGLMWCVDSTGRSSQETGTSLTAASDYTCD